MSQGKRVQVRYCLQLVSNDPRIGVYINYIPNPGSTHDKENLKNNIEIDKIKPKLRANESILMQKVSRILEKRDINKHDPKVISRMYGTADERGTCKSLKHSKNEIIARINNKYGKRMV